MAKAADSHDLIRVHDARENNLKGVSVDLPTSSPPARR
jgi:excinuclease UvrABC ATPase subunit